MTTLFAAGSARAQLRLRGDAYGQTQSPVGLLVLTGKDQLKPSIDAETVTWLGITDSPAPTGDVLTLSVRLRDVRSGSEVRAGRMLVTMGAVRPVHVDGARGLVRVFGGTTLEAFGGFPVARRFDYATFDWAAGGRLGQSVGDALSFGASYLHRRSDARRADEEIGADVTFTPKPWLVAAGRAAFDVVTPGPTDILGSIGAKSGDVRGEIFTTHRSPGRLLPSTSLFSVLGDFASTNIGGTVRWLAFPRLELVATGSGQIQSDRVGGQGLGRATLFLDDAMAGSIGVETRRVSVGDARWTGVRVVVGVPVRPRLRVASEIELVAPDRPKGGPVVWPWVLGAVAYRITDSWDAAAGVEASSGMTDRTLAVGLARLSYVFDARGNP
ncbi:MAG: hypothetical protein JST00_38480 [Deltaproteobacteria bacterium]|nr:hypothetical protein [Deltaproteobacteria bacterium]